MAGHFDISKMTYTGRIPRKTDFSFFCKKVCLENMKIKLERSVRARKVLHFLEENWVNVDDIKLEHKRYI